MVGSAWSKALATVFVAAFGLFTTGCMTYPRVKPDRSWVELKTPETQIPDSGLLDVSIKVFDPGKLPFRAKKKGLSKDIRKAEAPYMAAELRDALNLSGYWGTVGVVPKTTPGDEVVVSGKILKSDGEVLKIEIQAQDATGRHWFKRKFESAIDVSMYAITPTEDPDIFRNVYFEAANALASFRESLNEQQVREIRQVGTLQFAADMAPDFFDDYLAVDPKTDQYTVNRWPADEDVTFHRVQEIRTRDRMLNAAKDGHYKRYHKRVEQNYSDWRNVRLIEMNMIRDVEDKRNEKIVIGSVVVLLAIIVGSLFQQEESLSGSMNPAGPALVGAMAGVGVNEIMTADEVTEQAEINKSALEESGVTFGNEASATTIEMTDRIVELNGSAEEQYDQWRDILRDMYEAETGFTSAASNTNAERQPEPGQLKPSNN